jgi:cellulose synthase/poly-beta-1,6-N-acetylglucosamine synthase-like glycosyltransferase
VTQPFIDDPGRVVAAGGTVRAINGSTVANGRIVRLRMPRGWLARAQVVEYLRSFLIGRTGWGSLGILLLISGAFGVYRRDVVIEAGGLDPGTIGEDFELSLRVHRMMRDAGRDHRVVFVPEPVCWTEVPSTRAVLRRQRSRWHRGLWETLWAYRGMLFRRRYGRVGWVGLPYYWCFELFAPLVELGGLVLVPLGVLFGVVDVRYALALLLVSYGYAIFVTLAAICAEEWAFHRYEGWGDLGAAVAGAVFENLGYRQMTVAWRLEGWWASLRGKQQVWGVMTRRGFEEEAA